MVKTMVKVRNTTGFDFKIREGNVAGHVSVAKRGRSCKLVVDVNDIPREYVLIRMLDNKALQPVFSTDDVVTFQEILTKNEGGQCFWEGTPSAPEAGAPLVPPEAPKSAVAASIVRSVIWIGYVIYNIFSDFT